MTWQILGVTGWGNNEIMIIVVQGKCKVFPPISNIVTYTEEKIQLINVMPP